jgi:gluconate kinase
MKDLNNKLFILFGKAGTGKNYVAKIIEKEFKFFFYDGDIDLTREMVIAIKDKKGFTEKMRETYYERIKNRISELLNTHNRIVFTQGLFKNKHRIEILREFPFAEFILIESDNEILNKRVAERNNVVTTEYANKINKYFEEPNFGCMKIINNLGTNEILMQIRELGFDNE